MQNRYPFYSPRFWHGMQLSSYLRLLARNRFAIKPSRWAMTALVGGCSIFNSVWGAVQSLAYRKKIAATEIQPPIFIVGHWRTGTTLLHELLSLDRRFAYPSNYDCFVPCHFLVTRWFYAPLVQLLLPRNRPMDDMPLHPDSPQEDEFALLAMGAPTPYLRVAFPRRGAVQQSLLNLGDELDADAQQLRSTLQWFFKALTVRYGAKTLVLKSPPHTGRIVQLASWFPGARFIHIARHPHRVVPSTMKLWQTLEEVQSFQPRTTTNNQLLDYIDECQQTMYDGYLQQRDALGEAQLFETTFEQLTADPLAVVQAIYDKLQLGSFANVADRMREFWQSRQSHRVDARTLEPELAERIQNRWSRYAQTFGYDLDDPAKPPAVV